MYTDYYVYVFMCMYVTDSPGLELPPQFSPTVGELELVREDFFFFLPFFLFSFGLNIYFLIILIQLLSSFLKSR